MLKISRKGAEIFRNERRGFIEIFNFKIPKIIYKKTSLMKNEACCLFQNLRELCDIFIFSTLCYAYHQ